MKHILEFPLEDGGRVFVKVEEVEDERTGGVSFPII
jgi:hypothetical protein